MGLQGSTAGILGTICERAGQGRTRARATVARLDGSGHLALHPARRDSDSENVFRARWKTFPFVRVQPHHAPDRKHGIDHRRNHRRTRSYAHDRARRSRARPSRTQRDAKAESEGIFVIADCGVRSVEPSVADPGYWMLDAG